MQALALKYRPKNFDELIGQEAVSKSLAHALEDGRISHAYLFSGLRGSGKTSSARIFSKALVCDHGPSARPCETCPQCIMANESRHMDIIEMDAASHRKIDDIRELIEQTRYKPAIARYKIFIIDEVHMLTKEAFNALLKTLEEPPSYVKFILATTDPLKLPATVLSRTQHFRFKQISKSNIIKHLEFILSKEDISYECEALEILARSGSGSLRDTLTLLDQAIIYEANKITQSGVVSMLGLLDPARIENILNLVMSHDKEGIKDMISELEIYDAEMILDELIANLKQKFLKNDAKFSLLIYERFFRILAQAKGMLNVSSDNGFIFIMTFFMMIEALNLKSIDDMIGEIEHESKTLNKLDNLAQSINQSTRQMQNTHQDTLATNQATQIPSSNLYQEFVTGIYNRDYKLGEFFTKFVQFVSFEKNELSLIVNAPEPQIVFFRKNWNIVNKIMHSIFGENAKIVNAKKEESSPKITQNESKGDELNYIDDELANISKKLTKTSVSNSESAINLENSNTKSKLDISQNQIIQPQIKNPTSKPTTQNTKTPTQIQSQNNSRLNINFNSQKSPEELEKMREQGIINEATRLFGEPTILKVE
ncbi:DNA polymerase III subunit gamma/tau [Campylobacter sp. faydin G-24]|uniref:DNA polymerase III subunit gamma/tau n=1 Tax=Campylobacter anatolicus TaxID=2829105 RepID=A0ABS5HHQ0_9BACT|nr:DNA polymerase III subunit gamma/tau [Campylobacter anatolicus]MBR8463804.1 DNA polymerase III subunit gamma/tau [Campylobacter anatolicus]